MSLGHLWEGRVRMREMAEMADRPRIARANQRTLRVRESIEFRVEKHNTREDKIEREEDPRAWLRHQGQMGWIISALSTFRSITDLRMVVSHLDIHTPSGSPINAPPSSPLPRLVIA